MWAAAGRLRGRRLRSCGRCWWRLAGSDGRTAARHELVARLPRGAAARPTGTSSAWSRRRSATRTLETSVVPGLLQTPEYARAVTRAALEGLPDGHSWTRWSRCGSPGRTCCAAEPPLELSAVLDEAVLRRRGGRARGDGAAAAAAGRRWRGCPKCGCRYCRSPPERTSASPDLSLSSHFRTLLIWMWLFSTT